MNLINNQIRRSLIEPIGNEELYDIYNMTYIMGDLSIKYSLVIILILRYGVNNSNRNYTFAMCIWLQRWNLCTSRKFYYSESYQFSLFFPYVILLRVVVRCMQD